MKRIFAVASVLFGATCLLANTAQVGAEDYYVPRHIPGGHTYGPGNDYLPPLNSERDRVNAQADIREVEIQRELRERRAFQEQLELMNNLHQYRPGRSYAPY